MPPIRIHPAFGRSQTRAWRSRRTPVAWRRFSPQYIVPVGIVGTCMLAGFAHANGFPSCGLPVPTILGRLAEYAGQSAEPILKVFEKGKEVASTLDKVAESLRTNWEAIMPLMARLQNTAKIQMSLPALYQKFAHDVPRRIDELDDMQDILDDPPGDWKDVDDSKIFLEDEKMCRIALAAYGPIILGSMGLLPLDKLRMPIDFRVDHYRHCIREYTGIPQEDIVFVSRESQMTGQATPELKSRMANSHKPEFMLCPLFFVAIDHKTQSIILSVRGTLSLQDVMTDCIADTAPFAAAGRGAVGHNGIVQAAELVRERGAAALEAAAVATGYSTLRLTGHSLGGAVAQALAISFAREPWLPPTSGSPKNLPPSIRKISAVAFGPPPYISVLDIPSSPSFLEDQPAVQLPSIQLPLLPWSYVHDMDLVPRLSMYGAEMLAAFVAGDESTPQDPELFLPSEVIVIREEEGRMKYVSLKGSDRLLCSRLLVAMMLGLKQSKPMTDHFPEKYDKMLRHLRVGGPANIGKLPPPPPGLGPV